MHLRRSSGPRDDLRTAWGVAIWLLVASVPVVAWWVIGDQSETTQLADDYFVRPWQIHGPERGFVGLVALACTLIGVALGFGALRSARVDRKNMLLSAALLVVAEIAAVGMWRTFTAATHGANIGGGFLLLVGPTVISSLLWAAADVATRCRPKRPGLPPLAAVAIALTVAHFVLLRVSPAGLIFVTAALVVTSAWLVAGATSGLPVE